VLDLTGGTEIVGVGAILIGVALFQGYKDVSQKFLDASETGEMSREVKRGFTAIGIFGQLARMVVFGLTGYGLIRPRSTTTRTGGSASTEPSTSCPTTPTDHSCWASSPPGSSGSRCVDRRCPLPQDLTPA
jgi:hypothetical protein